MRALAWMAVAGMLGITAVLALLEWLRPLTGGPGVQMVAAHGIAAVAGGALLAAPLGARRRDRTGRRRRSPLVAAAVLLGVAAVLYWAWLR